METKEDIIKGKTVKVPVVLFMQDKTNGRRYDVTPEEMTDSFNKCIAANRVVSLTVREGTGSLIHIDRI